MLEVKGTLAKLLAQEDLIVEHRQVETAQFDVEKRIFNTSNVGESRSFCHRHAHCS